MQKLQSLRIISSCVVEGEGGVPCNAPHETAASLPLKTNICFPHLSLCPYTHSGLATGLQNYSALRRSGVGPLMITS